MSCCGFCFRCVTCQGFGSGVVDYAEVDEDDTRTAWRKKWDGFLKAMKISKQHDVDSMGYVFSLMLRLYAHKPVLHELEALYAYRPERFIFYVPQFVNFALHGAQDETLDALECFLHDKSEHSLRFAQRLFWFIRSYSPNELDGLLALESEKRAGIACKQLYRSGNNLDLTKVSSGSARSLDLETDFQPTVPLRRFAKGPPHVLGVSPFQWAVSFFDEFTNMGIELKDVPEKQRNKMLRATLKSLEEEYFPSNVVYLPIGNKSSRIVGIITTESFCFKTNTRVPFMVCLEVVDDPVSADIVISDHLEDVARKKHESLGGRIKESFASLQRQLSSSSSYSGSNNTDKQILMTNLSASKQMQPMEIGSSVGTSEPLGQWAPKATPSGRGAGFSHFVFHKDFEFESMRKSARQKALAQHHSSEQFTDIDLESSSPENIFISTRHESSGMLSVDSEDSMTGGDMLRILNGANGTHHMLEEEDDDDNQEERENSDDEGDDDDSDEALSTGVVFKERWGGKEQRIAKLGTKYSHLPGWRLVPVIVKSGDDLRQEQFVSQMIALFNSVFKEEGLDLWLHPYDVLAVSPDSGLIQAVPDTISLDSLKKNDPNYVSLKDFFVRFYGKPKTEAFKTAQKNFCESLAAYCIVCFLLQIKDRHNGNIMLACEGHVVHIDWGYVFTQSPGNMNFEQSPFKLTAEFVQLLGGPDSAMFRRFRLLCCKAFLAARKRREQFILMVEMMLSGESANLPCFQDGPEILKQLNERFCVGKSRASCVSFVNDLIDTSVGNWRSRWYDIYQRWTVGIAV